MFGQISTKNKKKTIQASTFGAQSVFQMEKKKFDSSRSWPTSFFETESKGNNREGLWVLWSVALSVCSGTVWTRLCLWVGVYRWAGSLPGRVMLPKWSTGSGWASVLNTQLSSGNRSSLENNRYRYLWAGISGQGVVGRRRGDTTAFVSPDVNPPRWMYM